MHFVSIGTFIFMLLFWLGTYLVTIWLMSLLFPASSVTKAKKGQKSELPGGHVSAVDRNWLTSIKTFCTMPTAYSAFDSRIRVRRDEVMPVTLDKHHQGG